MPDVIRLGKRLETKVEEEAQKRGMSPQLLVEAILMSWVLEETTKRLYRGKVGRPAKISQDESDETQKDKMP